MSVFVYNQSGLVEERPETDWKAVGHEIHAYNLENPESERKLFVGASFPPPGKIFDVSQGKLRDKTLQEKVDTGELTLPEGYSVQSGAKGEVMVSPTRKLDANGDLADKTMQEQIDAGLVEFDAVSQKVADEKIVPKTKQELVDEGVLPLSEIRDEHLRRLRDNTSTYFKTARTPGGYSLDELARQKAAFSYQFYAIADTDPVKADLLSKKLIYPGNIVDEIMAELAKIQNAYDQAVLAVQTAFTGSQVISVFESVKIENYIV